MISSSFDFPAVAIMNAPPNKIHSVAIFGIENAAAHILDSRAKFHTKPQHSQRNKLLDYKTDRRKAESDFLRAYRAQLNLYAIAIEKRFAPKKVTYKGIYSFALGKLIEA